MTHRKLTGRAMMAAGIGGTILLTALTAGCGNSGGGSSSGGSASTTTTGGGSASGGGATTVTYAIIPKELNNPVFAMAQKGAEAAAADLHKANPGTTYNVIYQASQTGAAAEQSDIITTLANKHVDGMSISVIDSNADTKPINDAVDAGVPVMCFDSDDATSKRSTLFSISDEAIGQELAHQLVNAVGGPSKLTGEVAILSGQSSAPNLQGRVKGVQDVLNAKDFPGVKFLPILYCDDNTAKSVDMIRTTEQAHPNLRGWVLVGGWPLFASHALDTVNTKTTPVVSMDTLPQEMGYLQSGQVYCLIGQKYFDWGHQSVMTLEDIRTGKDKTPPKFIDSGYDLVFNAPTPAERALAKGNIRVFSAGEYAKQWKQWSGG